MVQAPLCCINYRNVKNWIIKSTAAYTSVLVHISSLKKYLWLTVRFRKHGVSW